MPFSSFIVDGEKFLKCTENLSGQNIKIALSNLSVCKCGLGWGNWMAILVTRVNKQNIVYAKYMTSSYAHASKSKSKYSLMGITHTLMMLVVVVVIFPFIFSCKAQKIPHKPTVLHTLKSTTGI